MKRFWDNRYVIFIGLLIGLFLMPPLLEYSVYQAKRLYTAFNPVVDYQSEVVKRDGDKIYVHIWGTKRRDCDCVAGSLDSFAVVRGVLYGVHEERVSGDTSCRPPGLVDIGTFVLWPVPDAEELLMRIKHNCNGHIVSSEIARVKLK